MYVLLSQGNILLLGNDCLCAAGLWARWSPTELPAEGRAAQEEIWVHVSHL